MMNEYLSVSCAEGMTTRLDLAKEMLTEVVEYSVVSTGGASGSFFFEGFVASTSISARNVQSSALVPFMVGLN